MSAQIISLAEYRSRRQMREALATADAFAAGISRADLAAASRALTASLEKMRRQAVLLSRARARHARRRRETVE